ncbi:hypothetical protein MUCCIDRAFT_73446 [Mucor lusitanicus CBS 277.49]|uniref:Phosphoglycerate kinase n=1 Tax=Mucor lusitanicus CBS 277.49 TaxID=747725 RepID=A0A168L2P3_MUCCL|nr:hypothetical protein MUCCIDRAFT_73446 [Mucor lusitanicus CBS 277.49]
MPQKLLNNKLSIQDLSLDGKRVLLRVDFNVPIKDGIIADTARIQRMLPTIDYTFQQKAHAIIIMSHLKRPHGKVESKYSLAPVAAELQTLLPNRRVRFLNNCVGPDIEEACQSCDKGDVILLENLRFHPEEEGLLPKDEQGQRKSTSKNANKKFCASLSRLADLYVDDALSTMHRSHASITGVNLPFKAAGLLLQQELEVFAKLLDQNHNSSSNTPFLAILGGAKLSPKYKLITHLLTKVDTMIICGALAWPFLNMGDDKEQDLASQIMAMATEKHVKMVLPVDFVTASDHNPVPAKMALATVADAQQQQGDADPLGGMLGLDCGPASSALFEQEIMKHQTILWNGAPGVYEYQQHFSQGTRHLLDAISKATADNGAMSVVCGKDTTALVAKWSYQGRLSHVSSGGNASLELLEGNSLPGLAALSLKR